MTQDEDDPREDGGAPKPEEPQETRAEALKRREEDALSARLDYEKNAQAVEEKTERLRALRLTREAAEQKAAKRKAAAKPKPKVKANSKPKAGASSKLKKS